MRIVFAVGAISPGTPKPACAWLSGWRNAGYRAEAGGGSYYVVRPGDTLSGISAQLGTTVRRLAAASGIANPNVISVGQRIYY